jgi:hypothetical protein
MANAPRAITGVSFNNSRRLILSNFRLSDGELIELVFDRHASAQMGFKDYRKVTEP